MASPEFIYTQIYTTPRYQLNLDGPVASQPILDVSLTPKHEIGTIIHSRDVLNGVGEFVYLKAPAGTEAGRVYTYRSFADLFGSAVTGVISPLNDTTPPGSPLVIAMMPYEQTAYGWFATEGTISVKVETATSGPAYAAQAAGPGAANAGLVTGAVRAGYRIGGAQILDGGAGGLASVQLSHPTAREDA